jgi:hypothetical protein
MGKRFRVPDCRHDRRGRERPHAFHPHQPLGRFLLPRHLGNLPIMPGDALIQFPQPRL